MTGRILVADPMATNRIILKTILESAEYRVGLAGSLQELARVLDDTMPGLVLLDTALPSPAGADALEETLSLLAARRVPVVALTADTSPEARVRALRAGARDIIVKPVEQAPLLARLRSIFRAEETSEALRRREATVRDLGLAEPRPSFAAQGRVALVGDDPDRLPIWQDLLRDNGLAADALTSRAALSGVAAGSAPDAYVIEVGSSVPGSGLPLLAELRSRPASRHAAILAVHGPADTDIAATALDLGASDLIAAGSAGEEFVLRVSAQVSRKREAERLRSSVEEGLRLAVLDPLTGLFNRRYAEAHLRRISNRAAETEESFAVIAVDIDRFKAVNDRYGHSAGDRVIVEVARRLRDRLRTADMVARIGGEEFLVVLPETSPQQALRAAERLCGHVGRIPVSLPHGLPELTVTISLGLAVARPGTAPDEALAQADRALYESKRAGRNMVTVWRPHAA